MSKHTPGPWKVARGLSWKETGAWYHIVDSKKGWVAQLWNKYEENFKSREESKANARLIATAPEMLEVLEWLFNRYRKEEETCLDHYERLAEQFYSETGRLAPGKSEPLDSCHPDEKEKAETQHVWDSWNREGFYKVQAVIKKARGDGEPFEHSATWEEC